MPTLQNRIGIVQEIITNGVVDHVLGLRLCKKWPNSSASRRDAMILARHFSAGIQRQLFS